MTPSWHRGTSQGPWRGSAGPHTRRAGNSGCELTSSAHVPGWDLSRPCLSIWHVKWWPSTPEALWLAWGSGTLAPEVDLLTVLGAGGHPEGRARAQGIWVKLWSGALVCHVNPIFNFQIPPNAAHLILPLRGWSLVQLQVPWAAARPAEIGFQKQGAARRFECYP